MEQVVRASVPLMKREGFRKRSHTFNRSREPGAVEVINFQMGPSDPPGTYDIPWFRPKLQGHFTINLGVAFEEFWNFERTEGDAKKAFPSFLNEYDCHLRSRLGSLMGSADDLWWKLTGDVGVLGREIIELIQRFGIPWLERFGRRRAVLTAWERREKISDEPNLPLVIAVIYAHEGQAAEARALFRAHYEAPTTNLAHARWLYGQAARLGIRDLPPPDTRHKDQAP